MVTVNGSMATAQVAWADGETETMHWRKEGDTWMIYGNQRKYRVEARSQNWPDDGQRQYMVNFEVEDPDYNVTSVTITGPGIPEGDPLSLDYDDNERSWNSWHTDKSLDFGNTPPTPLPLTYTFTVIDPSETDSYTYEVQSFVDVYATDLSPSGTATDPLVFSWTGVGSGYTYQVQLSDADGNGIWDSDWGLTTTSVNYDGPILTPDAQYHYWVVVGDWYGNESFAEGSFSFTPAAVPGDVDNNGSVDLADAILALQVVVGLNPAGVNAGADVNGNGKIGLAEVIYAIQYAASLR